MTEHIDAPTIVEAQTNARSETVLTINGQQSHIAARSLAEAVRPDGQVEVLVTAGPVSPAAEPAPRRASFLPEAPPSTVPRTGWRGRLARLGIKVEPSQEEQRYNADVETSAGTGPDRGRSSSPTARAGAPKHQ